MEKFFLKKVFVLKVSKNYQICIIKKFFMISGKIGTFSLFPSETNFEKLSNIQHSLISAPLGKICILIKPFNMIFFFQSKVIS